MVISFLRFIYYFGLKLTEASYTLFVFLNINNKSLSFFVFYLLNNLEYSDSSFIFFCSKYIKFYVQESFF